jgi:endonuclease YncB( thermonuclease family)
VWKKIFTFIALTAILSFIYFYFSQKQVSEVTTTVSSIIDGDTILLANGDKVRLIGVDAPEKNQPYFKEVIIELEKLKGKQVKLVRDKTNKDRYGRLLRYVFLGDYFVNLELLRNGLAYAYVVAPDDKYAEEFFAAEKFARENKLGIWNNSEFAECIFLDEFHFDAKGEDSVNLNDEYVIFQNRCPFSINMNSWTLADRGFNKLIFFNFSLPAGAKVKIFSGNGTNSDFKIYWNSKYPVWNNDGDTLILRDEKGKLVFYTVYGKN